MVVVTLPRGNLTIGRVGLDVDLNEPQFVGFRGSEERRIVNISGYLRAGEIDDTQALRDELLAQIGQQVIITYDNDERLNGAAILDNVFVDLRWTDGALLGEGFFRFDVDLTWIGSYSEVEYQSLLSSVSAAEDHATQPSYWHSPPVGARAYSAGAASPSLIERESEDGDIMVAYDIPAGTHPTWSVAPENYYLGAVELWAGDYLRAGRDMPMDVTDWEINGKTIRVKPGVTTGESNGRVLFAVHNGSTWETDVPISIAWAGTNVITGWDYVTCLRNTPEAVTIRLVRDAVEDLSSTAKHELDITVRRGARLVSCVYKFDGSAQTHQVRHALSGQAATRPGGTASYIRFDSTVDGSRWLIGCPKAFTADEENGRITLTSASLVMPFFVGVDLDDSGSSGDSPADLAAQYVGQSAEAVRAVRR